MGWLREGAAQLLTLLDALGIAFAGQVGQALGAPLCQHLAELAPDRVSGMVLLGPIH